MYIKNLTQIGKAIVIKGTQAVTLTAGVTVIGTLATKGVEGLKGLSITTLLK